MPRLPTPTDCTAPQNSVSKMRCMSPMSSEIAAHRSETPTGCWSCSEPLVFSTGQPSTICSRRCFCKLGNLTSTAMAAHFSKRCVRVWCMAMVD